jgi:cell surface protein SprA
MRKILLFLLVLLCGNVLRAQVDPAIQDTTKTGFSVGKLELENPPSVLSAYKYDPVTDRYIYTTSVDGFSIDYPLVLTPKEYEDLVLKESRRNYFRQKMNAIDGKKAGSEDAKKDLLPRYYINSSLFESVFGSNTIDVKPTGSVEMDLGLRYNKQDNPSFSPRNRSSLTFDFDQRISMSLMGKVGTRLEVNANYDTQSTFAFQNLFKLAYTPSEDDIIQKVEVGNVSMPLNSTLIRGAQSLFGVKTQLQFGKTTITGVFSEQKSQTKSIVAEGGGTIQNFDLYALDYDNDRHFFLSQYFRNKYDESLRNYPFIDSRVQITRLEVWVTNKQNRVSTTSNNLRNIIALQDLGEAQITGVPDSEVVVIDPSTGFFNTDKPIDSPTDNENNKYDPTSIGQPGSYLNSNIREIVSARNGFNNVDPNRSEGRDYSVLENARKLTTNEYTFNPQLGYISLQQRLANDEILAVSYEYTVGGVVYQVGEFGSDGVDATVVTGDAANSNQAIITQSLILKMLKSSLTNVNNPVWNLMMKNIYQIPGAYQVKQDDFRFNILYTDPSPINYIKPVAGSSFPSNPTTDNKVEETPLLKVFNLDKLNYNNDPQAGGDGFFDYLQGITFDAQNGRIIFTTKEPFGELLFKKLQNSASGESYNDPTTYNVNQQKYVFRSMYRTTQSGALQDSDKNKFLLRGKYKSSGSDGIPIGAFNVPQGSVVVTAGGRVLVEGIDYSVDYQLGRVQILDASLQASNTPIEVSLENNSVFGQQTRRFMGLNIEHKISDKFVVGGTYLKMTEKPFTQKSSYGQESVNNTIFGFNGNYSTEVPFFTRLVNKLPNIDTDVPSNLSIRGEVAFLRPDAPKASDFDGEATIYVDDFEGSQSTIDMRSAYAWSLASTPFINSDGDNTFGAANNSLDYGYKRAKLAWYSIDPVFYTDKPSGISNNDLSLNTTRRIYSKELYPNTDIAQGQLQVVNTLDLSYYPSERGPYNNNPDFSSEPGNTNYGGIMRALNSTNFEQSNVEYIQFWVLDPYVGNGAAQSSNTGKVYFNLGEVSEDILKDGRKQYENGLGPDQIMVTPKPIWGDVPASQSLIYAFDTNEGNRANQDVGLDGLQSAKEATVYTNYASEPDPAADNYTYYLNASGGVQDRYKNYNGVDGNSAVSINDANRGSTTLPDVEDINRDNTMNTINAYYEYSIDIKPGMQVGQNYITDIREPGDVGPVELPNGSTTTARWIQFKIPVSQPQNTIGNISDFRSIRFMRMFMTGFNDQVTMRFGALDLVRGEWRRYDGTLDATDATPNDDGTDFDVQAVNIQENGTKCPVNYVIPPGVQREQLYNNNTVINQNEQSLALRASGNGLEMQDSRAVFKNVSLDMRQYKKLKMFLHAESLENEATLGDDEMVAFIRFGNDFTQNFYQVEIPLKVTQSGGCKISPDLVWPEDNEMNLVLSLLTRMKIKAMSIDPTTLPLDGIYYPDNDPSVADGDGDGKLRLGIKGNPNFGLIRNLMVGIKNNNVTDKKIKGEVWFNELRLADMENKGGMAAILNIDTNMADFATVSATGRKSTIGFGALEEGANERDREDIQQYNIVTNLNLGKLLPPKWGINVPFNYAIGEEIITPEYDPFNQDIKLKQLLDETTNQDEKDNIKNRAIDYTKRKSINFIGVRKDRAPEQKSHVYDIENFTFSQSYNQVERHDYEIEDYEDELSNSSVNYAYTFQPKEVVPFKKTKFMKKSDYWKLLSDINFNYLPSNVSFNTNILRQSNRQQFRQIEDVQGIGLDPLYRRNFAYNYQYGFGFNLTKSLKLNYTAASNNIVKNYLNDDNTPKEDFNIWDDYFDIGIPNQHSQQLVLNYDIPINKLPVFSFIKANYSYTADYNWQRSSTALSEYTEENPDGSATTYDLGNTIQNANSNTLSTTFNMTMLYKYLGLTPGTKSAAKPKTTGPPKPGEKIVNTNKATPANRPFYDGLIGVLTSLKNIQINYTENSGTVLPGYTPSIGFLGTSKPSLGFVFGSQDDVRYESAKNGWLTTYDNFNQNFTQVNNKLLKVTANIDLFPDFKIDLNMDRSYSENTSEQYSVVNGNYTSLSPYTYGMFSISTVLIKTAFKASDENQSAAFDDFRGNRLIIANRLAEEHYGSGNSIPRYDVNDVPPPPTDPTVEDLFKKQREIYASNQGYPIGYGKGNQAVLLPAFLAAYTGGDAEKSSTGIFKNFPIPNWSIKYNGLMRYKFFKDKFKRFSLQHNYRASYTVNQFRSNFDYDKAISNPDTNPMLDPISYNFYNKTIMSNVNLVEQFSPLLRVDFELKGSLRVLTEVKKDRALSMSFDNNLLTEVKGIEYVVGLGYRFKDVIFSSRLADNPTGIIKSDINIKADFSYRNNQTLVRYLDYDNNQLAAGQNIWSVKLTADYAFSKNLTAIFYYDHSFSKAVISTSFPLTNIRSGFTLRYNFGN